MSHSSYSDNRRESTTKGFHTFFNVNKTNSNWSLGNTLANEKLETNPQLYIVEMILNQIETYKDCLKYRFVVNNKAFAKPVIFNPIANQPALGKVEIVKSAIKVFFGFLKICRKAKSNCIYRCFRWR